MDQTIPREIATVQHGAEDSSPGQCGTGKTKLMEGNVRLDAEEGLDPRFESAGICADARGHAEGAIKLDA